MTVARRVADAVGGTAGGTAGGTTGGGAGGPATDVATLTALGRDGRLAAVLVSPRRAARWAPTGFRLPAGLAARVPRLWAHQAEAIGHVRAGRPVVVATGPGSGKSLCWQVPVAETLGDTDPLGGGTPGDGTALVICPTRALAADQVRSVHRLGVPGLRPAVYDGGTDRADRARIRRDANIVVTNPEMVHASVLAHHRRWERFLARLRFVVLDEIHAYRGVFGSHTAHVVRRLLRLASGLGASPALIAASATIADPAGHTEALCGVRPVVVDDDGSPRGEVRWILWDPPVVDRSEGRRVSAVTETVEVTSALADAGRRVVVFCPSRRAAELVARSVAGRLGPAAADRVRCYRSGLLDGERREVEDLAASGALRVVVATSALEAGVDLVGMDAAVLCGFPGTVTALRQQAGRVGRAGRDATVVVVAGPDQLDRWYLRHPRQVLDRPPEPAVVNPAAPGVLETHLECAAAEAPLVPADIRWWGPPLEDAVRRLVLSDRLRIRNGRAVWAGSPARGGNLPWSAVGLRTAGGPPVVIRSAEGVAVGTVDRPSAPRLVHPGACYLHAGETWRVVSLDLEAAEAVVVPAPDGFWTRARTSVSVRLVDRAGLRNLGGDGSVRMVTGTVEVTEHVTGYEVRETTSDDVDGPGGPEEGRLVPLELPSTRLVTGACWWELDGGFVERVLGSRRGTPVAGALHAAEHAAIGLTGVLGMCDRSDVGGVSTPLWADAGCPTIVIYDGHGGASGVAALIWDAGEELLAATREVVAACRCGSGCPSCVQSPKCGNGNQPLDRWGALALLDAVLDGP